MEKLETELAALRSRAETLSNRHAAAEAAFADAKSRLQRHHVEAALDDAGDKVRAKLEAAIASCAVTRDGYADAINVLQAQIADTEQKLTAERETVERATAAAKLEHDLDEIERALPDYLEASRRLADALEATHWHYESGEMSRFVGNGASQVGIAGAMALQELRNMVTAIRDGHQAIPVPKPSTEPVATIEPAPQTQTVFLLRSVKFRDHASGKMRHVMQFEDCEMPMQLAHRALRCNAAVGLGDPRRRELHGARGGQHANPNASDIVDLDSEEATRPLHVDPIMASDPVAQANIRPFDRGVPERKLSTAGPRP